MTPQNLGVLQSLQPQPLLMLSEPVPVELVHSRPLLGGLDDLVFVVVGRESRCVVELLRRSGTRVKVILIQTGFLGLIPEVILIIFKAVVCEAVVIVLDLNHRIQLFILINRG